MKLILGLASAALLAACPSLPYTGLACDKAVVCPDGYACDPSGHCTPVNGSTCNGQTCTCADGLVVCDGACVDVQTNAAHCGECGNACSAAHGSAACVAGVCTVSACDDGHADCDGQIATGCETVLATDERNCGACGIACDAAHGVPDCSGGVCTIASCFAGFRDCDTKLSTGCEVDYLNDVNNCGGCAITCPAVNGQAQCLAGLCGVQCADGYANCDGAVLNGCETDITSPQSCGSCGNKCETPGATPGCAGGHCVVQACDEGRFDCDGQVKNGCEVDLTSDVNNCGVCGTVCSVAQGTPACVKGVCKVASCDPGYDDCNGDPADGCETNKDVEAANCGACGHACSTAHGEFYCAGGKCTKRQCAQGWDECNNDPSDGCETNVDSDVSNCGHCRTGCANPPGGTAACVHGVCGIKSCSTSYFADCNTNAGDGCEVDLRTNLTNCGTCGHDCTKDLGASKNVAAAACENSICVIKTCSTGFLDCNGKTSDGCEVNSTSDINNCSRCGNICALPHVSQNACVGSKCTYQGQCQNGWGDCDGNISNGCETNVSIGVFVPFTNQVNRCGSCNAQLCGYPYMDNTCSNGTCHPGTNCLNGLANCDGQMSNGCETLLSSPVDCGSCGHACSGHDPFGTSIECMLNVVQTSWCCRTQAVPFCY